jgi:hypothetical protein
VTASARRNLVVLAVVTALALSGVIYLLYRNSPLAHPPAGCTAVRETAEDGVTEYPMTPEQAGNAATVAAVGSTMGMSERAIVVALATALQESGLRNLSYGDRDSIGLFQQRPSQGWGSVTQIGDTVYASRAFFRRLDAHRGWTNLSTNDAAQAIQRSAVPDAYAQWEGQATALAAALTGGPGSSLTCHDLRLGRPQSPLVTVAKRELGTAALSGRHEERRGRQLGAWLVAHAVRFGIDRVTVNGSTWTADSGEWEQTGPADGTLQLHQLGSDSP